jgi:hypothetical protein
LSDHTRPDLPNARHSLAADSYTFAALLVDEDFVLITAINGTLGA